MTSVSLIKDGVACSDAVAIPVGVPIRLAAGLANPKNHKRTCCQNELAHDHFSDLRVTNVRLMGDMLPGLAGLEQGQVYPHGVGQ